MDLPDRVLEIARQDPDRIAVVHVGVARTRTTTYRQLSHRAESIAVGLREIGVAEGTKCSFMVPPGADAMVLGLALWRVGAVIVGIEPHSHGLRAIGSHLARVGPEVFFGTPEAHLAQRVFGWGKETVRTRVLVGCPSLPGVVTMDSLQRPWLGAPQPADVEPDDPAVIAFTTGSTGAPKPTVSTHQNLTAMLDGITRQWGLTDLDDVVDMPTFPMFWIIGLGGGGTVVVPPMNFTRRGPGQANAAKLVKTINDHRVGSMFASPALLTNLTTHCNPKGITLPSVTRIVAGGAEINGPLYAAVEQMIPNGEIYSNYGATEALPVAEIDGTTVLRETWKRTEAGEGLCVGTALAGVEVKIIEIDDDDITTIDEAVELPTGAIGEVIARSPHISDHYFDSPRDMAGNKIADGDTRWHRLGDTGWLDEDGRLWVCGRRSHRVTTADRTYFALCCEPIFNSHPDVARSALIGPHIRGEVCPAVCIELEPAARSKEARVESDLKRLAERHAATEGITRFIFVDHLPVDRRHNAKIDRPTLARKASEGTL